MIRKILFVFISFFAVHITARSQDLFNLQNSRLFADFLINTKQYDYAAREYERIVFLDPENDSAKHSLIKIYFLTGDYSLALRKSSFIYPDLMAQPRNFALEYSRLLLLNDSTATLNKMIIENKNLRSGDLEKLKLQSLIMHGRWKEAYDALSNKEGTGIINYPEYMALVEEGLGQKYKNPVIAIGLSAVLPGAGKVYTKDWKDGLFSFLAFGSTAFQSYRGFSKFGAQGRQGWIFGGIATVLYSGNLYGSNKAAKKFNHKIKHRSKENAKHLIINNY